MNVEVSKIKAQDHPITAGDCPEKLLPVKNSREVMSTWQQASLVLCVQTTCTHVSSCLQARECQSEWILREDEHDLVKPT